MVGGSGTADEAGSAMITVVIADDHATVRSGLRLLLESAGDIAVAGEAADGAAAVTQVRALRPDVVLMDARMPGTDGIAATRQIVAESSADVLMLTTFDLDEVVFGALRAGAAGFLLKSAEPADLVEAIRRVAAGDGVVAPEVTRRVLDAFAGRGGGSADSGSGPAGRDDDGVSGGGDSGGGTSAATDRLAVLTAREREVLAALGRGLSNAQLARELVITEATVKSHVSSVLAKLHLNSRMQAAVLARECGLGS
ncbi:response regulator [Bogoriella caseilytica]|uniref:LuxR family two component transcriptional regulator n=1 Tax=Bogoriella caseilytica TaxID=56055 RepID=A0A3N2BAT3_9MICO|nr:response regulator transcription factor [Bogoriella caseilytica]ROR72357.1 LuxR family two component transcriptional regulator [Bogoriella caseilytica]